MPGATHRQIVVTGGPAGETGGHRRIAKRDRKGTVAATKGTMYM
jgi:hypothetical protein